MCLAQGPQRSDAGEARTRGPSASSQALYHIMKECSFWHFSQTQEQSTSQMVPFLTLSVFTPNHIIYKIWWSTATISDMKFE